MPRVYESRDLTKQQADESAQAARDDIPPALDVQEIAQPGGLYTVIATYADVGGGTASPADGKPPASKTTAPASPVAAPSRPVVPAPDVNAPAKTSPGQQPAPTTGSAPSSNAASTGGALHGSDPAFNFLVPVVNGNDIVVSGVTATWFGGPNDPSDNGKTKSGISTVGNPQLLGCALPMDGWNNPNTDGSPIPKLPWQTQVRVSNKATNRVAVLSLIDIGPSKKATPPRGIDLTTAAFEALGVDLAKGTMTVDYTIVDGAKYLVRPGHGQAHDVVKPPVKQFIRSPNVSSRNGVSISMIVMHYTDGSSAQGAIDRFSDPANKVSAHYIIERNGDIYQMVEDSDEAWHARAANPYSIGIEHVALPNQQMSDQQTVSSVALVAWLMKTYQVSRDRVVGHRYAIGENTDCPDHLFGQPTKQAVVDWVNKNIPIADAAE
jgi:hypothetical protein